MWYGLVMDQSCLCCSRACRCCCDELCVYVYGFFASGARFVDSSLHREASRASLLWAGSVSVPMVAFSGSQWRLPFELFSDIRLVSGDGLYPRRLFWHFRGAALHSCLYPERAYRSAVRVWHGSVASVVGMLRGGACAFLATIYIAYCACSVAAATFKMLCGCVYLMVAVHQGPVARRGIIRVIQCCRLHCLAAALALYPADGMAARVITLCLVAAGYLAAFCGWHWRLSRCRLMSVCVAMSGWRFDAGIAWAACSCGMIVICLLWPMYPGSRTIATDVSVPADGLCQYHCIVCAQDYQRWLMMDEQRRTDAAYQIKGRVVAHFMEVGDHVTYARISQRGSAGYLEESEFAALADAGGVCFDVELENGTVVGPYGGDDVRVRMHYTTAVDGAGVAQPHYQVRHVYEYDQPVAAPAPPAPAAGDVVLRDCASISGTPMEEILRTTTRSGEWGYHKVFQRCAKAVPGYRVSQRVIQAWVQQEKARIRALQDPASLDEALGVLLVGVSSKAECLTRLRRYSLDVSPVTFSRWHATYRQCTDVPGVEVVHGRALLGMCIF